MPPKTLQTLYLHGFLSSAASQKGQWFARQNRQHPKTPLGEFHCPTYHQKNLPAGLTALESQLKVWQDNQSPVLLIGSSLGGYLVQYLGNRYQFPYVMINPALNPCELFNDYLGNHRNPHTGETLVLDHEYQHTLAKFDIPSPNPNLPTLLLADAADEVIDLDYAVQKYHHQPRARVQVYPGGNHNFTHLILAWQEILDFVERVDKKYCSHNLPI